MSWPLTLPSDLCPQRFGASFSCLAPHLRQCVTYVAKIWPICNPAKQKSNSVAQWDESEAFSAIYETSNRQGQERSKETSQGSAVGKRETLGTQRKRWKRSKDNEKWPLGTNLESNWRWIRLIIIPFFLIPFCVHNSQVKELPHAGFFMGRPWSVVAIETMITKRAGVRVSHMIIEWGFLAHDLSISA